MGSGDAQGVRGEANSIRSNKNDSSRREEEQKVEKGNQDAEQVSIEQEQERKNLLIGSKEKQGIRSKDSLAAAAKQQAPAIKSNKSF